MLRTFAGIGVIALLSIRLFGQSVTPAPVFNAADVQVSAPATNPYTLVSGGILRGSRYDLRKATMLDLIRIAWGADPNKIVGGPNWLELDRFDISAKAPQGTSPETIDRMLQSLLEDRFGLVLHKDTRPLPAFALTKGKEKPKLKAADGSGNTGCQSLPSGAASCRNMTMDAFAGSLHGMAGAYLTEPVVNSTGIEGIWDFDIKWNPRAQAPQPGAEHITIFDAIDKQLGLKLEPQKVPMPVIVIDRVNEKPTANPPGTEQILPPRSLAFDVATIRPTPPDEQSHYQLFPGGGLDMRGNIMKILLATAWDVDWDHADEKIAGLPKWAASKRFDIVAKTNLETNAPGGTGFMDDDLRLMLRALLIDRFQMKTHYEDRPVRAYTLTAIRPKLQKADPSYRASCKEAGAVAHDPRDINPRLSRLIQCRNITMAQFAQQLQSLDPSEIPNEVTDSTGIEGSWDFTISFTPAYLLQTTGSNDAGRQSGGATASDPNGGLSFFDAIGKQLGLKLEMRKRTLPVLVIDHMDENPTDN